MLERAPTKRRWWRVAPWVLIIPIALAVGLKVTEGHESGPPTHRIASGGLVQFVDRGVVVTGWLPAPLDDPLIAEADRDLASVGAPPVVAYGLFHIDATHASKNWVGAGRAFGVTTSTGQDTACVPIGEVFNEFQGNLHGSDPAKSARDGEFAVRFSATVIPPDRGAIGDVLCAVLGPEYQGQTGRGPTMPRDAHIEQLIW